MKITQLKDAVRLCFESKVTPALVSVSGIGKTTMGKQLGEELGFDTTVVLRPSLVADAGDIVGLPDFEVKYDGEKRTTFHKPDWLPGKDQKALIIIDEINRAKKDVIMAMFDLIEAEEPKIGNFILAKGSKVIATLNPPTDDYSGVIDFNDQAFVTRMSFIKVDPDLDAFKAYGRNTRNVSEKMISFLENNLAFTTTTDTFEVEHLGIKSDQVNYRSLEKISNLAENSTKMGIPDDVLFEVVRGIKGLEFAQSFIMHHKNYVDSVSIQDILSGKKTLKQEDTALFNKLNHELSLYVGNNELTKKQYSNVYSYLNTMPLDLYFAYFYSQLNINQNTENLDEASKKLLEEQNNRKAAFVTNLIEAPELQNRFKELQNAVNDGTIKEVETNTQEETEE